MGGSNAVAPLPKRTLLDEYIHKLKANLNGLEKLQQQQAAASNAPNIKHNVGCFDMAILRQSVKATTKMIPKVPPSATQTSPVRLLTDGRSKVHPSYAWGVVGSCSEWDGNTVQLNDKAIIPIPSHEDPTFPAPAVSIKLQSMTSSKIVPDISFWQECLFPHDKYDLGDSDGGNCVHLELYLKVLEELCERHRGHQCPSLVKIRALLEESGDLRADIYYYYYILYDYDYFARIIYCYILLLLLLLLNMLVPAQLNSFTHLRAQSTLLGAGGVGVAVTASPARAVTVPEPSRVKTMIPIAAAFYAFVYPLTTKVSKNKMAEALGEDLEDPSVSFLLNGGTCVDDLCTRVE
jgi:hypothetical protein